MRKNISSVLLALWYTFLRNNQSFLNTVFTAEFFWMFLLSLYACVIILVGLWRFLDNAKVSSQNISFHIFLLCMFNQIWNDFSTTRSEWPYLSNIFQMFLNDGTLKMNIIQILWIGFKYVKRHLCICNITLLNGNQINISSFDSFTL